MAGLVVRPRARIYHGHDWVYATEIQGTFGEPQPGEVIQLKSHRDRPLGSAIYNPESQIVARRFSRQKQELDADFFERRLARAVEWRQAAGVDSRLGRVAWSEADGLPGVVIDRYGDHAVLQTLTLAMDLRRELIAEAMIKVLGVRTVIERNDSAIRKAEGLELRTGALVGEVPDPFGVERGGRKFTIDLQAGQKTGLYLDQLDNQDRVAAWAKGRKVLDVFAHQGGFSVACALAGAASCEAVEISTPTVEAGRKHAAENGVDVLFHEQNAFDFLKAQDAAGARYDLIVLDPPSFTKNKKAFTEARRGYKEIHLRALKMLDPGGLLFTFVCSHHVGWGDLRGIVIDAAVDSRRTLREIEMMAQPKDHPVVPTIPETEYLKGFGYEAMPGW